VNFAFQTLKPLGAHVKERKVCQGPEITSQLDPTHESQPEIIIDGRVRLISSWAWMCQSCHTRFGAGLGLGKGQKYLQKDKKDGSVKLVKIEG
jgi:hypothetical protein